MWLLHLSGWLAVSPASACWAGLASPSLFSSPLLPKLVRSQDQVTLHLVLCSHPVIPSSLRKSSEGRLFGPGGQMRKLCSEQWWLQSPPWLPDLHPAFLVLPWEEAC